MANIGNYLYYDISEVFKTSGCYYCAQHIYDTFDKVVKKQKLSDVLKEFCVQCANYKNAQLCEKYIQELYSLKGE